MSSTPVFHSTHAEGIITGISKRAPRHSYIVLNDLVVLPKQEMWRYKQDGGNPEGHYSDTMPIVADVIKRFVEAAEQEPQPLGDAFVQIWAIQLFHAYTDEFDDEYNIRQHFNAATGMLLDE